MRNMIIFELPQQGFLLKGQHTCGDRRVSCLVLMSEETEKQEKGF